MCLIHELKPTTKLDLLNEMSSHKHGDWRDIERKSKRERVPEGTKRKIVLQNDLSHPFSPDQSPNSQTYKDSSECRATV